jgi:enoyl-CoA hydratase/carnithine racemase
MSAGAAEADVTVAIDAASGVATITLDRPEKLNALRDGSLAELEAAIAALEADDRVHAVVLRGSGRAFCAGADIKAQTGFDAVDSDRFVAHGQQVFGRLRASELISVAALHGFVLGGGLELAMSCDVRVAAAETWLGQPEVSLGHIPGWGGTQLLPALVGRARALELLLGGERVGAAQALAIGLVDAVVDGPDPVPDATARARRYAGAPRQAVRALKTALHQGATQGLQAGLLAERAGVALCWGTDDSDERRRAFGGGGDGRSE